VQSNVDCGTKFNRNVQIIRQEIRGARWQECQIHVFAGESVNASLDGAVTSPYEEQVRTVGHGLTGTLRCFSALGHFVPKRIVDALFDQYFPQLAQSTAEHFLLVRNDRHRCHEDAALRS
jgi:hypothetical protein